MFQGLFSVRAPYRRAARWALAAWTLLLLALCFLPGRDIPDIHVPLADKWVHFVLFGVFAFLWLCAFPSEKIRSLLLAFTASVALGWLVEELQGLLSFLGRSRSGKDILADAIGGLLGVLFYYILSRRARRAREEKQPSTL